jgi:hypothetical protein
MYFNQVTGTYEKGKILGANQFQYGDQFNAPSEQVADALKEGSVVATDS